MASLGNRSEVENWIDQRARGRSRPERDAETLREAQKRALQAWGITVIE